MSDTDGYDQLKITDLLALCRQRGIPETYRLKGDLVNRLITYDANGTGDQSSDNVFDVETDNDHTTDSSNTGNNSQQNANNTSESGTSGTNHEISNRRESDGSESGNNGGRDPPRNNIFIDDETGDENMTISFRDVEDALRKFKGEAIDDIEEWIAEFEVTAETCKWNDVQKYMFCRKLLRGEAQLAMEANREINSYATLIAHLKTEHEDDTGGADIYIRMSNRKKTDTETYIEFMYKMKKMASDKIDEQSVCKYIVNGLPDSPQDKITLFEATTYKELKRKLKAFAESSAVRNTPKQLNGHPNGPKKQYTKNDKSRTTPEVRKTTKCYNCGTEGHGRDTCPDKERGKRCFNCQAFGHVGKDCRQPKKPATQSSDRRAPIAMIEQYNDEEMMLSIEVNRQQTWALLDTGSPYTVMDRSLYEQCSNGNLGNDTILLKGFAGRRERSLGSTTMRVMINDNNYNLKCQIVNDGLMSYRMLLGRNLMKLADVAIIRGVPIITKHSEQQNDIMMIQIETNTELCDLQGVKNISNERHRNEVIELITNYKPNQPQRSCVQMELELVDKVPVYQHPRRLSLMERKIVQEMVQAFMDEGIVRPSRSDYASPILLRPKKNGKHRLCVDYRKLNMKIVKDRYPLPIMDSVLEDLYGKTIFSSIDLKNGFHHVDMAENSVKYTSFITPDGQFEYLKAPFGLCNSPAAFQRYINQVMHEAQRQGLTTLYLDDILIAASSPEENLEKLRKVLTIAMENGLMINWDKCEFLQNKITFLGNILQNGTITPSEEKTEAVRRFPTPSTPKMVQSFLGLTGYFRKFIGNYGAMARPLTKLLQKDATFVMGPEQMEAYEKLKQSMIEKPVLRVYNQLAETQLHTDASALGYGGCLMQKQADDGAFHPVHYISYKTTEAESRWHSYELEVVAIIKCVERLRTFLIGIPFVVITDCKAFEMTMAKKNATAKIARWALLLEEYNMTVKHRPGKSMGHVDALSRHAVMLIEYSVFEQVKQAQQADEQCKLLVQLVEKGVDKENVIRSGVLYHFHEGYYKLVVPQTMVHSLLQQAHGDVHLRGHKMEQQLRQDYHIPDLSKKIDQLISNCVTCILAHKKRGKQEGWLHSIDKGNVPLDTYHIDHIGPMESTKKAYAHILVVVDAFTKFVWLHPVKTTKIEEALTKLNSQQAVFGNPRRIVADKASSFRGTVFGDYCSEQNIDLHLVTTATPRGNGQVERINGIVKPLITKLAIAKPTDWFKHVDRAQRAINSTIARSIGTTPFELMFGVKMNNKEDVELIKVIQEELMISFDDNRQRERGKAMVQIAKLQAENKKQYNKHRKQPQLYALGDLVAIERVQPKKGAKFHPQMLGPYSVTKVLRNDRYLLTKIGMGEGPVDTSAPADRMKPWSTMTDSEN